MRLNLLKLNDSLILSSGLSNGNLRDETDDVGHVSDLMPLEGVTLQLLELISSGGCYLNKL